ncbi:MAG: helix-turn-helix transcriptional regulator [Myxococcales bacterium]|nr:helix-turn-helix transcriptional regulator [Myxococcales bacterium]
MTPNVLVLTHQVAVSERWRDALRGHGLEVVTQPPDEPPAGPSAAACVLDAESFPDGDALLSAAALADAHDLPVAVDLGRGGDCDELVVEIAKARVVSFPAELPAVARRLARVVVDARDPRLEFVTLSPDGGALLAVLSSGQTRLELRPLHEDDDGGPIASITLVDDGRSAEIVTAAGAVFRFDPSPAEALDGTLVGRRVRELRIKAGITQAELARRTGIHRPNIARVEAGKHMPSLETVARLAEALGTSPARILEGTY